MSGYIIFIRRVIFLPSVNLDAGHISNTDDIICYDDYSYIMDIYIYFFFLYVFLVILFHSRLYVKFLSEPVGFLFRYPFWVPDIII